MDATTTTIIASMVRLVIAFFIMWVYARNKNKFAFYTSLFVLSFCFLGVFRILSVLFDSGFLYFLSRILPLIGAILLLQGLGETGVEWIRKYKIVLILGIFAIIISYSEAFVFGGIKGESVKTMLASQIMGGIVLLTAAFYINKLGKELPKIGKNLLVWGFGLEGLLHFAVLYLVPRGLTFWSFLLGLIFFLMIGAGWLFCVLGSREIDVLNKQKQNKRK